MPANAAPMAGRRAGQVGRGFIRPIHIVYSVTEQDIKKFDCLLLQVNEHKRRQALQVKKPVIDPKLEQALSKMDDREDEDAKDDKA